MRKFLAVLMAAFMLTAALAVLPASAAVTKSDKDGSVATDADAIDLVITEVLADTQSNNVSMKAKNAFQYIEIYKRSATKTVNIYDYAIVRATYNEKSGTPWAEPRKFEKKIVLDTGSIYDHYVNNNVANIAQYNLTGVLDCVNALGGDIGPGETALIWIWNQDTKDVFGANGGTTATGENQGNFNAFRNHYKDLGKEIPNDVKIFATFGVDGIGQSFQMNTTKNYMYALVEDGVGSANTFDIGTEIAYSKTTGGNFETNAKIKAMFKFGTALGYYNTTENNGAVYTLANKTPNYTNTYFEKTDANYYESGDVDSFKEMACIYYDEAMTPGTLLPVQWADIDPDHAPAAVKGTDANWATTAWNTYVAALVAANGGGENTNRPEENKNQSDIDVNRNDLGNLGQNKAGEWTFFIGEDGKYYRYKTEGGSKDEAVEITKEEYDTAMAALAELEEGEGLGIWLWVIIGGAAVVVLGGAAVVLIIVLKKKNKNVAADDVAGFVEIIDEDAAAPAEDAAAPAEEKTEE